MANEKAADRDDDLVKEYGKDAYKARTFLRRKNNMKNGGKVKKMKSGGKAKAYGYGMKNGGKPRGWGLARSRGK